MMGRRPTLTPTRESARLRLAITVPALALVVCVSVAAADVVVGDHRRLETTVSAGFDSFGERFSIDESDTLDVTNDVRSLVGLGYQRRFGMGHGFQVHNTFGLSQNVLRNTLRLGAELRMRARDQLTVSSELGVRRYRSGGAFTLSSDHFQELLRVQYRARMSEQVSARLRHRTEILRFADRSSFEYDYQRFDVGGSLEIAPGPGSTVDFGYDFKQRSVPDSTAIDYVEHALSGNALGLFGTHWVLDLASTFERRRYRDETVRPGYFYFELHGGVSARLATRLELRLRQDLDAFSYDIPSEVYFNRFAHLTGFEFSWNVADDLTLSLEPRFAYLNASAVSTEEYRERSLRFGFEWMRLGRLWLRSSLDTGRRDYDADGVDLIFSDYAFLRTNVFSTVEFARRYAWNLFLSHEPERHENGNDDTTTTLLSTDITVRF